MIALKASADFGLSGQYIARITGRDSKFTFKREFIGRKVGKRNESSEADVDDGGMYECCDIDKKRGKQSRFVLVVEVDGELMSLNADKEDAMTISKMMDAGRPFSEIVVGTKADPETASVVSRYLAIKKLLLFSPTEQLLASDYTLMTPVGPYVSGTVVKQSDLQPVINHEMKSLSALMTEQRLAGKSQIDKYEIVTAKEAEKKQSAQTIDTALDGCWVILKTLPLKDAKKVLAELKIKLTPPKDEGEKEKDGDGKIA